MTAPFSPSPNAVSALTDADSDYLRHLAHASPATTGAGAALDGASATAIEPDREAYRIAAFLHTFDPLQLFPGADEQRLQRLLTDCTVSTDGTSSRWMLRSDVRVRELRAMCSERDGLASGARRTMEYLREAGSSPDEVTRALLATATGEAGQSAAIAAMSKPELAALRAVINWLHPLEEQLRFNTAALTHEIECAELLEPFRFLTGFDAPTNGDTFVGRVNELRQLREFIDTLRSEGITEAVVRGARRLAGTDRRMLCFSGVGGIGKSTLLAKFILQHVDSSRDVQLRFAYLDFDRSIISAAQPVTMLLEILRQVGWQVEPVREALEQLRRRVREEIEASKARTAALVPPPRPVSRGARMSAPRTAPPLVGGEPQLPEELIGPSRMSTFLYDAARALEPVLAERMPLLLVVDTFEEAQALGDAAVRRVESFLEMTQTILKNVRVVIAGRDAIDGFFTSATRLVLTEFEDAASRVQFLERRGVPTKTAHAVASQVGGRPLSLHLAARLVREHGLDAISVSFMDRFRSLFNSTLVDGILYKRILEHIKDKDVRAMVHPGLVLRRLDVGVLCGVVAPTLAIPGMTEERARRVIATLALQKDLVRAEADGSVSHRQDVREQMLKLMNSEKQTLVSKMHLAAARYFAGRQENAAYATTADSDRIEEIYHRLSIGDSLDRMPELWIAPARTALASAVNEITNVGGRGTLEVLLGRVPGAEELRALPERMVREYAERAIVEAIDRQDPEQALVLLHAYRERLPEHILARLEPRVFDLAGEWDHAGQLYRRILDIPGSDGGDRSLAAADFFERALDPGDREHLLALLLARAERDADGEMPIAQLARRLAVALAAAMADPERATRISTAGETIVPLLMNVRESALPIVMAGFRHLLRRGTESDRRIARDVGRGLLGAMDAHRYSVPPNGHERWLLTLSDDIERDGLKFADTLSGNDTVRGQLAFARALMVDEADGSDAAAAARACDVLSRGVRSSGDDRALLSQVASEGTLARLLRHIMRPDTPQWYVPIACQLRRTLGGSVLTTDLYISSLPELPFRVQPTLATTRELADFLGRLDQLGVLHLCLEHSKAGVARARNEQLSQVLYAYAAWRHDLLFDVDEWIATLPRIRSLGPP